MTRMALIPPPTSSHGYVGQAARLLLAISILFSLHVRTPQQVLAQRPEGKPDAEIGGVKFATPPGFSLEQSSNPRVAFMRHAASEIALFVTVPDRQATDQYLIDLSTDLASQLLPQQNSIAWKIRHCAAGRRLSLYQISCGTTKGLNGKKYIQTEYLVLKAQGHEIVVGSIATFGEDGEAKFLFEVEGREYSFIGWQALFQILPSITGEVAGNGREFQCECCQR